MKSAKRFIATNRPEIKFEKNAALARGVFFGRRGNRRSHSLRCRDIRCGGEMRRDQINSSTLSGSVREGNR